jgi:SAM-dependent methyltransferase
VMDVGAGLGEFLRHIRCGKRIAVDVSPMRGRTLPAGTVEVIAPSHRLAEHVPADSVDVAFCSNFFEHLPDKDTFLATMSAIRKVLKPGGRLLVLQPNIRVLGGQYWDFVDHHLPLTDRTLVEASLMLGFEVEEIVPRFLPYTTRSRLPQAPWLVRLYLLCRPAWWLFGGQAWLVARKPAHPSVPGSPD